LNFIITRCLPTAVSVIKADQHYDRLRNLKETLRNHGKMILRLYLYFSVNSFSSSVKWYSQRKCFALQVLADL